MTGNKFEKRFANILQEENPDYGKIWEVIKRFKSENLSFGKSCRRGTLEFSVPDVARIERTLQVSASQYILQNVEEAKLKIAGEMFLYLISCSEAFDYMFLFLKDLFENEHPDRIILILNKILKNDSGNLSSKKHFEKIFKKMTNLFTLKYPAIQSYMKGLRNLPINLDLGKI